jgi:gliding motility-associated-like protein
MSFVTFYKSDFYKKFGLFLIGFFSVLASFGQLSNKGKDFWLGFPHHRDWNRVGIYLYITSDSSTTVTVSIPGQNWSKTENITANSMTLVSVPRGDALMTCNECTEERGVHITAGKDVVVYSHMYYNYRSDATLVLPTKTAGQEYYIMSYNQWNNGDNNRGRSQFIVVANQDDTKVRITPTRELYGNRQANTSYTITLDEGEIYQARARNYSSADDLTGTHIEVIDTGSTANCRTVSVFSGSSDTRIGGAANCGGWLISSDNLYQQLFPVRSWGNEFITVPFASRGADNVRVMASEDGTQVVMYNKTGAPTIYNLDAGEFATALDVDEEKYIRSNKPISVAQYQITQACTNGNGDPSMTILSPLAQTLKDIVVYNSQYEDIDDQFINVIIPSYAKGSFRIDGNSVNFTTVQRNPNYSYAQISTTDGNHRLTADEGFIAVAYGFGGYESYGYSAGANVKDLSATIELANSVLGSEGKNTVCLGQEADFKGNAEYKVQKWEWHFGDGDTSQQQNVKHEYKDTGTYQVKLYTFKEDFDGCSNFDSVLMQVSVYGNPVAQWDHGLLCEDLAVRFDDSSQAPPNGKLLFTQWQFNGSNVYAKYATRTYDTTGKYHVRLIVASDKQCRDTMEDSITVNAVPIVDFKADDVCFYDSTRFTNLTTLSDGTKATFEWDFGDGDTSLLSEPVHYYQDSGQYSVLLEAVSDSGCFSSHVDTVFKRYPYTIDFAFQDTCFGLEMDFTNTSTTTGKTIDGFYWKFPSDDYTTKDVKHTFTNHGTFDVMLRAQSDTICVDSTTKQVVVYPGVDADFSVSAACFGDTIRYFNESTVATGGISHTYWNFDDGITQNDQDTVEVNYPSDGTKSVQLIAESDKGCRDTVVQDLDFFNPEIDAIVVPKFCRNEGDTVNATLSLGADAKGSYVWRLEGTQVSTDSFYVHDAANLGKHEIVLTITSDNGCEVTAFDTITVFDQPIAAFFTNAPCEGDTLSTNNSSLVGNGEMISNIEWKLNNQFYSNSTNIDITGLSSGKYPLTLTVTTPAGCTDSLRLTSNVNPNPEARIEISDTCAGDVSNFTSLSTVSSGTVSTYYWTLDDGSMAGGSSTSQSHPDAGTFTIDLIAETDKNCRDTVSRTYTIAPLPVIDMTPDPTEGCLPLLVNVENNSSIPTGTISTIELDWGDGITNTSLTHTYSSVANFDIGVTATSDAGCISTSTLTPSITVLGLPTADFTFNPDDPSILNPIVDFNQASSADATTYGWIFHDGSVVDGPTAQYTFTDSGRFAIQHFAINDNGCADTITKIVRVTSDLFFHVPTSFSPNGDGLNDEYGLGGLVYGIEGYYLRIFNRYGGKVFETDDPGEKWDGTLADKPVQDGVYVYEIGIKDAATRRWQYMNGVLHIHR